RPVVRAELRVRDARGAPAASSCRRRKPRELLGVLRGDGPSVRNLSVAATVGAGGSGRTSRGDGVPDGLLVPAGDSVSAAGRHGGERDQAGVRPAMREGSITMKMAAILLIVVVVAVLWFVFLAGQATYPD